MFFVQFLEPQYCFIHSEKLGTPEPMTVVPTLGLLGNVETNFNLVGRFIGDAAAVAAASGFNPEVAALAIAARTAQEGVKF